MRTRTFFIAAAGLVVLSFDARADEAACALASSAGVDPIDAQTAAELVCHEVGAESGRFRVRIARLDKKIVLGLTSDRGERHLVLDGLDEVPTAAPRLVESFREEKPVAETQTTDNIVGEEARTPKRKPGEAHAWLGVTAVSVVNRSLSTNAGVELGMSFGSSRTAFVLDLRLAGESFMEPVTTASDIASLGLFHDRNRKRLTSAMGAAAIGARQYLAVTDVSPYAGIGLGLAYLSMPSDDGPRVSGTGVMPYAEIGVDILRTHTFGGLVGLKVDVPTFALEGTETAAGATRNAKLVPIYVSMLAAVRF